MFKMNVDGHGLADFITDLSSDPTTDQQSVLTQKMPKRHPHLLITKLLHRIRGSHPPVPTALVTRYPLSSSPSSSFPLSLSILTEALEILTPWISVTISGCPTDETHIWEFQIYS